MVRSLIIVDTVMYVQGSNGVSVSVRANWFVSCNQLPKS